MKIEKDRLIKKLKCKDEKICYEQNKVVARNNKLNEYKTKVQNLKSTIDLEIANKHKSEEKLKTLM